MPQNQFDRRQVLSFGAATAFSVWPGFATASAGAQKLSEPQDRLQFTVDIPGCPEASKNIREIKIDELTIDPREMTAENDADVRMIRPGSVHVGAATLTSARARGGSKELHAWFMAAAKGKNIRKNITVTLFKSDKSPGRTYNLFDCYPVQYSSVSFDTSSTVQCETIVVKMGRVELA